MRITALGHDILAAALLGGAACDFIAEPGSQVVEVLAASAVLLAIGNLRIARQIRRQDAGANAEPGTAEQASNDG